jgi:hypothetical protein
MDLRDNVRSIARLPYAPDRLLDYLRAADSAAADDPNDPDHSVFWLVVADQFAKRGIDCAPARDRALAIIADGTDLATMAALGMDRKSLGKRRVMLEELRARIAAPSERARPRAVLKAPQKLLLQVGDVLAYPTSQGDPINPYAVGKEWQWAKAWRADGWGAFVVIERGLVFDFLAWYRPLVVAEALTAEPTLADLVAPRQWLAKNPGTLSARHAAAMRLKSLGRVPLEQERLQRSIPRCESAMGCVVGDISIVNNMSVRAAGSAPRAAIPGDSRPRLRALGEILAADGVALA